MDRTAKAGIIPGDRLKLYRLRKLGSAQEYLNPSLFNNSNKSTANK